MVYYAISPWHFLQNRSSEWSSLKQLKFIPDDEQFNQNVVKTLT